MFPTGLSQATSTFMEVWGRVEKCIADPGIFRLWVTVVLNTVVRFPSKGSLKCLSLLLSGG